MIQSSLGLPVYPSLTKWKGKPESILLPLFYIYIIIGLPSFHKKWKKRCFIFTMSSLCHFWENWKTCVKMEKNRLLYAIQVFPHIWETEGRPEEHSSNVQYNRVLLTPLVSSISPQSLSSFNLVLTCLDDSFKVIF